ncbi:hypothetical protein ACHAXA_010865 [Cyclostephanos tholiformis]|uniref:MBD domain-containing protein n=1 Tax=Cyclostephanos tholiformis TaxID=382380 RepID=A0ABD3SD60_9STRA
MTRGRIVVSDDPGTMSKAGSGDDGRKRAWTLTSSSQPNKSKKLSPLALRALAALEHDDGISSGDDERDTKDCRHHDSVHVASGASELSEKSPVKKIATRSATDTVRSVVALTEGGAQSATNHIEGEAGIGFDDRGRELYGEHQGISEHARERNDSEICQNFQSPDVGHVRNVHKCNERNPSIPGGVAGSVSGGSIADDETLDSSSVAGERIAWDVDCVCPHVLTSDYGDVLSCFLSTPFDDKAMLSLHTSKEDTNTIGLQIEPKSGKNEDFVPILPQKIFIKFVRERKKGPPRSGIDQGLSGVSPAVNANVRAQVNIFLMQECQKIFDSTKQQGPIHNMLNRPVSHEPDARQQLHLPREQQRPIQDRLTSLPVLHEPDTQQQLHQSQRHQFHPNQQQMLSHLQAPNYFGSVQGQNSFYPMQMIPQLHRVNQQMKRWHYPLPFHTPVPYYNQGIDLQNTAYNNPAFTSSAQHTAFPAFTAPAQLGSELDNGGTSKISTKVITEKPYDVGKPAAVTTNGVKQNETLVNGKSITLAGGDKSTRNTEANPKHAPADGLTEAGTSRASKAHRSAAVLIESSDAPPDLPAGWTSKTFERANSEKKASDRYFYSAQNKIKFRSMKACKAFIEILNEPAIGGNELTAFKEFKVRGHKL